mgnify:CR=1 FL=1
MMQQDFTTSARSKLLGGVAAILLSLAATHDAVAQAAAEALGGAVAAVLMPRGGRLVLAGSYELPDAVRAFLKKRG